MSLSTAYIILTVAVIITLTVRLALLEVNVCNHQIIQKLLHFTEIKLGTIMFSNQFTVLLTEHEKDSICRNCEVNVSIEWTINRFVITLIL